MVEEKYDIIYKRLIRRFIISAVILLSVFILKQFIVHYQIVQEENTSYVVNIAGRQRMLSQKIVKDISLIQLDQTILDDEIYKKDLIESLELWEKSHSELLDLNKEEPLFKNDSSSINQMFLELEPTYISLKEEVKLFLVDMNASGTDEPIIDEHINKILLHESTFLVKMDSIVCTYEKEARDYVKFVEVSHTFLFVIIILTLIFIIFKIFIPLLKYLKNAFLNANESNKNLIKLFQTMKGALFVIKRDGQIFFMNGDAEKIISKENNSKEILYLATSVNWIEFDVTELIEQVKNGDGRIEDIETTIEDKDGNMISVIISAVTGIYNGSEAVMINLFDVTAQKQAENALKNIAIKDELTGLYNRHFLESIIDEEFDRAKRYDIPLSAALLDLDHFKKVNDKWGHPVGDSVLKLTANVLQNNIRKSDYAIRIGGEELLILMPNTDSQGAYVTAEKVRKAIEEAIHPVVGRYTASFGVAERTMEENYSDLYLRIDKALYQAKDKGRNCVVISDSLGGEYAAVSFKWNPNWNCGEIHIDEQHKELLRKVSQLVNSTSIETEKQNTINQIDDIISHIITHFNYEEKSLREVCYEDIQNHEKIHGQLLKRAQEIKEAVTIGKLDSLKAFAVIFEEIIVGHLLSEDMKFFPCYKVKET